MTEEARQFTERRQDPNNQAVVMLIRDMSVQVEQLKLTVASLKHTEAQGLHMTQQAIQGAVQEAMRTAFPGGDADMHRRHHEAVIKASEARAEFWKAMVKEAAKWGILSVLGYLAYWAWFGFLKGPKP